MDATFCNEGKINNNVALISTVRNDGGTFTNKGEINYNIACIIDDNTYDETVWDYSSREQTAAGGVANYSGSKDWGKESKFHNYGQINGNTAWNCGGGIYFTSGTLVVGGDSNITGNKNVNGAKTSNIYVGSGKYITFDTDTVLTSKAKMGVEYME